MLNFIIALNKCTFEELSAKLKAKHEKFRGDYSEAFSLLDENKQLAELNKESRIIRNELKRMNACITSMLNHCCGKYIKFTLS
jgi:hypothetical protein